MREINFLEAYHRQARRNYLERAQPSDKSECAAVAKQWGFDYWDGDRRYGYGGYHYDGRWKPVAEAMAQHYGLRPGEKVLDIGCGKAYLLYEFRQLVPGLEVAGLDISTYAVAQAKPEVRSFLRAGDCSALPWPDRSFDFVYSINTFHNLTIERLKLAVQEMQRVGTGRGWICVESYRTEREKANLLAWQLTCESFFRPEGWVFLFREWNYVGDYGFIYFE